jgi:2',3'-cyclic-nucleotide 2'-phosphodiesterase (5'-nucleotidase family)
MLVGCQDDSDNPSFPKPIAGEYLLPVIETTDVHGYIANASSATDIHYKMAYIADKVKDIRGHDAAYNKDRLLLLDGGDLYQGNTISNLQQGVPIDVAMNKMDYDAVTLGNHEFDWGLENMIEPDATLRDYVYKGQEYVNSVPVTCANLYQNGTRAMNTKDYVIVEKEASDQQGNTIKVKIGIVGFAADWSSSIMTTQFADKGYSIVEDYAIANSIASELESTGQCDATILLVHGAADEKAPQLGKDTPFDFVFGGHTHVNIQGETEWGLPYLQATSYGEAYAYAQLQFHVDENGTISFSRVASSDIKTVEPSRDTHQKW